MSQQATKFRPWTRWSRDSRAAAWAQHGPVGTQVFRASPAGRVGFAFNAITRDSSGVPLGFCDVYLFFTNSQIPVAHTVSDAFGRFSFDNPGAGPFYMVAFQGSNPVGTSSNAGYPDPKPITITDFSTSFLSSEAHLSQSGVFTIGDNSGLNAATGPKVIGGTPGTCCAQSTPVGTDYLGTIQNRYSGTKHYAEAIVRFDAGYVAGTTHEIEILLGFTLASGEAKGYELDFWFGGTTLQPVRWNDDGGGTQTYDFGAVTTVSGSWPGALVDGDVIHAVFDSSSGSPVITVSLNGVQQIVFTDVTAGKIMSGSPGLGFFIQSGATPERYAIKGFSAGNA